MLLARAVVAAVCVHLLTGCGGGLAGTYRGGARLMEGREPSNEPGYTLADIQARIEQEQRTLTLERGGRFVWNTGSAVNEGKWRREGGQLILRDDISNGIKINPVLQADRHWRIGPQGELINPETYSYYGVEEVYFRP